MNIIVITSGRRPQLLSQTLLSLRNNASDWIYHHITMVVDGIASMDEIPAIQDVAIRCIKPVGASAARNIGASSIPKYRRQEYVLFLDDDVFLVKGWDKRLTFLLEMYPNSIVSGYCHPYNQMEMLQRHWGETKFSLGRPLVISSVAMMMSWSTFDQVGPWDEPGGAGASEDYALCMRGKDKGYGFAVTDPQCILHTGIWSSDGKAIVGQVNLAEQNEKLLALYGIAGSVVFG